MRPVTESDIVGMPVYEFKEDTQILLSRYPAGSRVLYFGRGETGLPEGFIISTQGIETIQLSDDGRKAVIKQDMLYSGEINMGMLNDTNLTVPNNCVIVPAEDFDGYAELML